MLTDIILKIVISHMLYFYYCIFCGSLVAARYTCKYSASFAYNKSAGYNYINDTILYSTVFI